MKTQETKSAQMDDIVFENRNKSYGAYILRKTYNKQVARALMISSAILIAGLAYPLVSSYNALIHPTTGWIDPGGTIIEQPPKDLVVPPDLPKPLATEIPKRYVFVTPIVVTEDVPENPDQLNMEFLNGSSSIVPLDISPETTSEKQPDVIVVPEAKVETFTIVEEMPSFSGGDVERLKFLSENMIYPSQAADNGIQGTVYVQFIIDSKGNITDANVIRGIGGGCDEEALRVVKSMPQWHPGKQNGRTVRVQFTMPIIFKLQG